jgi:3',5'-cyclic AMP phosphodiesterase CpdA
MQSATPSPAAPAATIRLAHVSDPHLSSLAGIRCGELLGKRVLGYLSWRLRRRREHRPEVLERLGRDLAAAAPDHILVTGDLTHVGTPRECVQAADWLHRLGSPDKVSVIPGNHDCYAPAAWAETAGLWDAYMQGDPDGDGGARFPWLRRRGPVGIIGLSTAVPTAPFLATGWLGAAQLGRLAEMLDALRRERLFRIVLLHHPPVDAVTSRRRRLNDGAAFRERIERHGAELILHGHAHRWVQSALPAGAGRAPVFGIPSASALTPDPARRAGYSLLDLKPDQRGWEVRIVRRRLDAAGEAFETAMQESFFAAASGSD